MNKIYEKVPEIQLNVYIVEYLLATIMPGRANFAIHDCINKSNAMS